jgi:hypothetical protein
MSAQLSSRHREPHRQLNLPVGQDRLFAVPVPNGGEGLSRARMVVERQRKKHHTRTTIGQVYVVHAIGTSLYKVGVCESLLENRLKHFTVHCPYPVELVRAIKCQSCRRLEEQVHERLRANRTSGEWFAIDDGDLLDVVSDIEKIALELNENEAHRMEKIRVRDPRIGHRQYNKRRSVFVSANTARLLESHCRKIGVRPGVFIENAVLVAIGKT